MNNQSIRFSGRLGVTLFLGLGLPIVLSVGSAHAQSDERMNHIPPSYMSVGVPRHSAGVMDKASPTQVPTNRNAMLNLDSRRIEDVTPVAAPPAASPSIATSAAKPAPETLATLQSKLQLEQMQYNGTRLQYKQATREHDAPRASASLAAMNRASQQMTLIKKQMAAAKAHTATAPRGHTSHVKHRSRH